ncbi:MAG: HAD-IA family hydrolase [Anaerolineaceae bacterium]|nr:HAD-IA family hydrolase [Anaerolineaceae bacterium]
MTDHIEAILFDIGGTLRQTFTRDENETKDILRQIVDILDRDMDLDDFAALLAEREKAYQKWANETQQELNKIEIWTRWMLPDWPEALIIENSLTFQRIWRDATGIRTFLPEVKDVILKLFRNGYRLGVVSNTVSSDEVPSTLTELGIAGYFDVIVLSCDVGIRKPNPAILLNAAERMGIAPKKCAYIGNNPTRDVVAAKGAGFAKTIIIRNPLIPVPPSEDPLLQPDHELDNLSELTHIFLPHVTRIQGKKQNTPRMSGTTKYDVSLSTMWGIKNFSNLSDFFIAADRLGFSGVELNHQINSSMLDGINLSDHCISSIHEPCPADISTAKLKENDWLVSSVDDDCRQQGVNAIRRSIDLAGELNVKTIVLHAGIVLSDAVLENRLRTLYNKGLKDTEEYQEINYQIIKTRAKSTAAHMESVKKSIAELLEYGAKDGIRLGLENRYHYYDIPNQDEMAELLGLADEDQLGFIYDVGHAQALDRLGFFDHEIWLKRFSGRMYGAHLHDVIGVDDHHAPGMGEIDFHTVVKYLPGDAYRACEVMSFNSVEQVRNGVKILKDSGCIKQIG